MGMFQLSNCTSLLAELLDFVRGQLCIQHLDRGQRAEVDMFTQVDISKATMSE